MADDYQQPQQPQGQEGQQPPQDPQAKREPTGAEKESQQSLVKEWLSRVKKAKAARKAVFDRMKENMRFAYGLQRAGQKKLDDSQYGLNVTLRHINQKVAALYARNPTAEFKRRKRLNFQLWDGKLESLLPVVQAAAMGGGPMALPLQSQALLMDYMHGMEIENMIDKVGATLEILFQWQIDESDPDFKTQMKNLVRRVITCGTGFLRVAFARDLFSAITTSGIDSTVIERGKRATMMLSQLEDGKFSGDSAKMESLRQLLVSVYQGISNPQEVSEVKEKLVFDAPPSTAVIVDEKCTSLKDFVGARWIALEYVLPLDEVCQFFECTIPSGGETVIYKEDGTEYDKTQSGNDPGTAILKEPRICLYEVFDKTTKTSFFICDGYKEYVRSPEPVEPVIHGFWPIFSLTFNDAEVLPGESSTSIYPPSDVDLIRSPQKEWIRSREGLRAHRKQNAPMYVTMAGYLTERDKEKVNNAESGALIELKASLPPSGKIGDLFAPKEKIPIDPVVYDVTPLQQDILFALGSQEANLGPPNPRGTATGQTIAEQSRLTMGSSNVDDIDDFLSRIARASGEIMLQEMGPDTVKRIAGPGAVFPSQPQEREDFLNSIYLSTKAASSGRPNKAIEIKNWQLIAPILMQAGANPQFMVRETLHRLDDQLDPEMAFPLVPPQVSGPSPEPSDQHEPGVNEPPQQQRPGPGSTKQARQEQQQPAM